MSLKKSKHGQDGVLPPKKSVEVGQHLRQRRLDLKLTLVELSEKCGVSFATISKIETGKVSGGFQTIYKIARGLGLLVTDILEPELNREEKIVLQRYSDINPHLTSLYDYYPQATRVQGRLNSGIMIVYTREVPERIDWSNHEGEEVITVLSGSIRLHLDGSEPMDMETGDSACFSSGTPHAYVCTSSDPARIIFVSTRPSQGGPV